MMARDRFVRGLGIAVAVSLLGALPAAAQAPATQAPGAQTPMAVGQEGRPLKIAVINGERVLAESNIGALVSQQAQEAAADWDRQIAEKQAEIDTLVAQGQEQRLTLTDEALARIQQDIEQKNVELQRLRDDAQRAMNRLGAEAQDRINAVLIPAVERLANEEGFDLILDTRIQGILFFADAIDATDRYIAMVNAGGE